MSAPIYQVVARRGANQTRVSVLRSTGASAERSRGRSAPVLTFFPIFAPRTAEGDGIAGIDSLDMAVMGRGLSHALGDQPMSMSIDDIGFSERG